MTYKSVYSVWNMAKAKYPHLTNDDFDYFRGFWVTASKYCNIFREPTLHGKLTMTDNTQQRINYHIDRIVLNYFPEPQPITSSFDKLCKLLGVTNER